MNLLLDTNIVSVLFKPDHTLQKKCYDVVDGNQCLISFMTRAELLLWPRINRWSTDRHSLLLQHIGQFTTLLPDDGICAIWADVMFESRKAGKPITASDAWIAATARRWNLVLVTTDYRDFEHLDKLTLVPI